MPKRRNRKAKKIISSPLPITFKGNDNITYKITPTEKSFCKAFLETNGNGTQASLLAFDIPNKELCKFPYSMLNAEDKKKRKLAENSAASMARRYIRKVQIIKYIDYLLDQYGFTDEKVKLEHFRVINQDKSWPDKTRGIDMFYRLKDKYPKEKVEHSFDEEMKEFITRFRKDFPK